MAKLDKNALKEQGEELKAHLAMAKKRTLNFAILQGKEGLVVVANPKGNPGLCRKEAKTNGGGPKGIMGQMRAEGKTVIFVVDEEPPGNFPKLIRQHFMARGATIKKIVIELPGGGTLSDGEEDIDGEGGGENPGPVMQESTADGDGGRSNESPTGEGEGDEVKTADKTADKPAADTLGPVLMKAYGLLKAEMKEKRGDAEEALQNALATADQGFRRAMGIAVAIGLDPAIMIAAGCRSDDDELLIAGALRGTGVPVCEGVTMDAAAGSLDIPAEAEIVIEGYLPPHTRHAEGPLAEFHGYYGELWDSPVFEVTAICHRDNPIYQTIVPGATEHIYLGNVLPREPLLLRFVRHVSKNVTGLHIPLYSNGFAAIVQLGKTNPGEPKNVALAAMTAHVNIKKVIVVGPDVDIYDPADVLWALINRVDWSQDVFTIPGAQGHEMDPTADARGVHTKIGIDATYKPERRHYGERIHYPDVDLMKYL